MRSILRRVAGHALRALRGQAVILLYHRVAAPKDDPELLAVRPDHFNEHLRALRESFAPLSLDELANGLTRGRLPRRAVAVTFDDGYVDNLENAKLLLERHRVPATVFVATEALGKAFWWDDLACALFGPAAAEGEVAVPLHGETSRMQLGPRSALAGWNSERLDDPSPRHAAYRLLARGLRTASMAQRAAALAALARGDRPDGRAMGADEIVELSSGGLVEVGAHSVSHRPFAMLDVDELQREAAMSRAELENIVGVPVRAFAYPFGGAGDIDSRAIAAVRAAGYEYACANVPGNAWMRSDRFVLPRRLVRDWSGAELTERLRSWFNG